MADPFAAPCRAPVRPRVAVAGGSAPRLLEEEIGELLAAGRQANVQLIGTPWGGLTTALVHLAAVFAEDRRLGLRDVGGAGRGGALVTVTASRTRTAVPATAVFVLLPWSDDDVLEYLLHAHREATARVFALWQQEAAEFDLAPFPSLCRAVLDMLAADDALDVGAALRRFVATEYAAAPEAFGGTVLRVHGRDDLHADQPLRPLAAPVVRAAVAAAHLVDRVLAGRTVALGDVQWTPQLLGAVRREMLVDAVRCARLRERAMDADSPSFAAAASLLAIACPGFRPEVASLGRLQHAWLAGVDLHGLALRGSCNGANFAGADLSGCDLRGRWALRANFTRAWLDGADLTDVRALGARLRRAHAPGVRMERIDLREADLLGAVLDDAVLCDANLTHADLDGASLQRADLRRATLDRCSLRGTDLRGADCGEASMAGLDLRTVALDGATLRGADLMRADLSGTRVPGLQAPGALFHGALLTGAGWPRADLRGANFGEAGLADVDWEGADLRDCVFTRATFHLGSSRSGLVGSDIAGEGSRTGFYTDESLEHSFQTPEDVRKANLRGCDLRGAAIEDCDFYLVDLRGARLDEGQRRWLRRCRAILDGLWLS